MDLDPSSLDRLTLMSALDVLEAALELSGAVPEWCEGRQDLLGRIEALNQYVPDLLKQVNQARAHEAMPMTTKGYSVKLDLDRALAVAKTMMPAWALSVELGEKSYVIRPLGDEDLRRLQGLPNGTEAEGDAFMGGLFEGEVPDVAATTLGQRVAVISAIGQYVQHRHRVNTDLLAAEIKAQIETQNAAERRQGRGE